MPGPSAYKPKLDYTEKAGAKYSLRPSTAYASMFNDPTKLYPGPGSYKNSRYKSPGNAVMSKQGKRFDDNDARRSMLVPGPGQYPQTPDKAFKNYGVTVIGTSRRQPLSIASLQSKNVC